MKLAGTDPQRPARGVHIILNHGVYETYYMHLRTVSVQVGQMVNQGDVISVSNNTGETSGPHLHLGFRDLSNLDTPMKGFIDPLPFFDLPV